jgi:uncharacterized membrane protein
MNGHYTHLLTNHFPIILTITGFIVLTIGLLRHTNIVKQVALFILLAASLSTIPAYISGEEAEHVVENKAGTSESIMEEHEEEAELAFILTDVLGVLAFVALLLSFRNHSLSVMANRIVWLTSLICLFFLFNVGKSGGQIRRPELRTEEAVDTSGAMQKNEEENE